jgi:hypothetical protein
MGLLDDAIREHLELKRRHGADPDEVTRQEREVLGSARGGGEFAGRDEDDGSEPEAAPVGADEAEEAAPEPAAEVEEEIAEPEAAAPGYDEDPWLEEERDEVPAEEALERSDDERSDEDVLEETPDFLQETPEHDRLWFEQRPPRDFDWDK